MAFCPSVFKLSFGFWFFPFFLLGACLGEVDFDDLEANLFFAVRFLWRGRSFWPWGTILFFYSALTSIGSISLTLRHEFDFCSALTSIGSISLTLRHDFDFCSALTSMGSIALTLRHEFNFYSALTSVGSISLTLRHEIIFYSGSLFWHPDSGLFGNFGRR